MSKMVLCHNRGCRQAYDPDNNEEGSCRFHPGMPFFHETYKGWSCCQKKSTDFTDFLDFEGCQSSKHASSMKPIQEPIVNEAVADLPVLPPRKMETGDTRSPVYIPKPRPSADESLIDLPRIVTESLTVKLGEMDGKSSNPVQGEELTLNGIKIGSSCHNSGCRAGYGPATNATCNYHPGYPVFHEGLKYWTCCQKRTSDFNAFLAQDGCESGHHLWIKPKVNPEDVDKSKVCRFDWHQTETRVCLTIYSKMPLPDVSVVKANQVKVSVSVTFGDEMKQFVKDISLYGVIDLAESKVTFSPTKVELSLKKAEPVDWKDIQYRD